MELRGSMRVFCRVKPLGRGAQLSLNLPHDQTSTMDAVELLEGSQLYHFDRVFSPQSSQETVFDEVKPFIQIALDGENVCIFAYGQTGSGKTFTMEGPPRSTHVTVGDSSKGIIPRCGEFIFQELDRLKLSGVNLDLQVACFEIYCEKV